MCGIHAYMCIYIYIYMYIQCIYIIIIIIIYIYIRIHVLYSHIISVVYIYNYIYTRFSASTSSSSDTTWYWRHPDVATHSLMFQVSMARNRTMLILSSKYNILTNVHGCSTGGRAPRLLCFHPCILYILIHIYIYICMHNYRLVVFYRHILKKTQTNLFVIK